MLIIEIKGSGGIEKALKTLKSKVIKTKQQKLLTEKKEYTKKSVQERTKRLKAIFVQKKKNN